MEHCSSSVHEARGSSPNGGLHVHPHHITRRRYAFDVDSGRCASPLLKRRGEKHQHCKSCPQQKQPSDSSNRGVRSFVIRMSLRSPRAPVTQRVEHEASGRSRGMHERGGTTRVPPSSSRGSRGTANDTVILRPATSTSLPVRNRR